MNLRLNKSGVLLVSFVSLLLSGCGVNDMFRQKGKIPIKGERISVLELQKSLEPDDALLEAKGLITPAEWKNEFWPQNGGYPNHSMQNLALDIGSLELIWQSDIGRGSSDEIPLVAQPIVVDGRVFTLDTEFHVRAFSVEDGETLWSSNIKHKEEGDVVIGGGLAFADATLFATNGFNEILAINPISGEILWRQELPAPSRAAPTVIDGRIFIKTLDNRLLALSSKDGSLIWEHLGLNESAGLIGAASAAANFDIVVPVFSSGEVTALRVENGSVGWSDNLANVRRFGGLESLSDIRALPVIDKGLVIAISFGGRMVAIDESTGNRVWQREIGGAQTPWIAGNHVFVISTDNELVALGRDDGVIRWVTQLDRYEDEDDKEDKIIWTGPLLAGGRLIVAGSNGDLVTVDPNNGNVLTIDNYKQDFSIAPVIAGGTLYLLSESGKLLALR